MGRWWSVEMNGWDWYLRFLGRTVLPTAALFLVALWLLDTYQPGFLELLGDWWDQWLAQ